MKTIVLGTDGSPTSEKATKLAVELARGTTSRLCVVAAWHTPLTNYSYEQIRSIPEIDQHEQKRAHDAAQAALDLAEAEGVEAELFVRNGDPVEMISQTAGNCDASCCRGLTRLGSDRRLLFGSVSTALLHHAPCPVLVARLDEEPTSTHAEAEHVAHSA